MNKNVSQIQDPPVARFLFSDTRMAVVWLIVRLYVGYQWLEAGWHKVQDPGWMSGGASLLGFWQNVAKVPAPPARAPISFDWYRNFIQLLIDNGTYDWFAKLVALGETLVGVGLIVGAFVGIAAFFGALMNFNFMHEPGPVLPRGPAHGRVEDRRLLRPGPLAPPPARDAVAADPRVRRKAHASAVIVTPTTSLPRRGGAIRPSRLS